MALNPVDPKIQAYSLLPLTYLRSSEEALQALWLLLAPRSPNLKSGIDLLAPRLITLKMTAGMEHFRSIL